jgi:hypothetical protein
LNENTSTTKTKYDIQDGLIKTRDGLTISGMVARKKGDQTKIGTTLIEKIGFQINRSSVVFILTSICNILEAVEQPH